MKSTILRGLILLLYAAVAQVTSAPPHSHLPGDWNELAGNTATIAMETLTSAAIISQYVKNAFLGGQEPPLTEPCFLEERDGREYLNGQLDPSVQYAERLVTDHGSVVDYQDYLTLVERESDEVSRTPYFQDLKRNMNRLQSSLESLLCSLVEGGYLNTTGMTFCLMPGINSTSVTPDKNNATVSNGTEEGQGRQQEGSSGVQGEEENHNQENDTDGAGTGPEYCQDTRYGYQYSMYLRIISLINYITTDIRGFRESMPMN